MTEQLRSVRLRPNTTQVLTRGAFQKGEIFYDSTIGTIRIMDSTTIGGVELLRADLSNLQQASLNQNLNVGSGDVTAEKFIGDVYSETGVLVLDNGTSLGTAQFNGNVNGNAATASKLATPRTITFAGGTVTGSFVFDGSSNVNNIVLSVPPENPVELGNGTTGKFAKTIAVSGVGLSCTTPFNEDGTDYTITSNATDSANASTIVARDSGGNFSANVITANLSGNVTGNVQGNVTGNLTGNADTASKLATARTVTFAGGTVTGSFSFDGSSDVNNIILSIPPSNPVQLGPGTVGQYATTVAVSGVGLSCTTPNVDDGTAYTVTSNATSANTASTLVSRDSNGDFSARNVSLNKVTTPTLAAGATDTDLGTISGYWSLSGTSRLQATYADLAEYYTSDQEYAPGTVVEFGGSAEVTQAEDSTRRVAGVVTTNPAYLMNQDCPGTRVAVALQGRVPVKVRGHVRKGDMMISGGNGFARPSDNPLMGAVIGKALEDFTGVEGVIEVVVGRL